MDDTIPQPQSLPKKKLFILFYTEIWECFCRFGIASVLVLYLVGLKKFNFTDAEAYTLFSSYLALYYIAPIIGGYAADTVIGHVRAILFGTILVTIGTSLLIIPITHTGTPYSLYYGLGFTIIGNGFFMPSVAALVGEIYKKHSSNSESGYTFYYLGKNLGALLAPIFCGLIGVRYGYNYAFILCTAGILSGLVIFALGHHHFQDKVVRKLKSTLTAYGLGLFCIPLSVYCLIHQYTGLTVAIIGSIAVFYFFQQINQAPKSERNKFFIILFSLICLCVFQVCLNQGGMTLNLFIDRNIDRELFGMSLPTTFFFALNPLFMLVVGPGVAALWAHLSKRNIPFHFREKYILAFVLLSLGFFVFLFASEQAALHAKANMFFIVAAYFIFPIAELCLVPISLSIVSRYAPENKVSTMISIWMIANALGNYLAGIVARYANIPDKADTTAELQEAAMIYHDLFNRVGIALFATAAIVLVLRKSRFLQTS